MSNLATWSTASAEVILFQYMGDDIRTNSGDPSSFQDLLSRPKEHSSYISTTWFRKLYVVNPLYYVTVPAPAGVLADISRTPEIFDDHLRQYPRKTASTNPTIVFLDSCADRCPTVLVAKSLSMLARGHPDCLAARPNPTSVTRLPKILGTAEWFFFPKVQKCYMGMNFWTVKDTAEPIDLACNVMVLSPSYTTMLFDSDGEDWENPGSPLEISLGQCAMAKLRDINHRDTCAVAEEDAALYEAGSGLPCKRSTNATCPPSKIALHFPLVSPPCSGRLREYTFLDPMRLPVHESLIGHLNWNRSGRLACMSHFPLGTIESVPDMIRCPRLCPGTQKGNRVAFTFELAAQDPILGTLVNTTTLRFHVPKQDLTELKSLQMVLCVTLINNSKACHLVGSHLLHQIVTTLVSWYSRDVLRTLRELLPKDKDILHRTEVYESAVSEGDLVVDIISGVLPAKVRCGIRRPSTAVVCYYSTVCDQLSATSRERNLMYLLTSSGILRIYADMEKLAHFCSVLNAVSRAQCHSQDFSVRAIVHYTHEDILAEAKRQEAVSSGVKAGPESV